MAQRTIRFRIRPDGRVDELVEGVQGLACESLTERIEARLGRVSKRLGTSDAFAAQTQSISVVQPLQQHPDS